jgi:hypothetical protein
MRKFIFVWFLAVGVISVVGVMWTVPSIRFAWGLYGSNLVRYTAGTVADALDSGGAEPAGVGRKVASRLRAAIPSLTFGRG